jgi:hypothetical protein
MKLRILTVVAATLVAFGSPAEAKGVSKVTITGVGLERAIVVGGDGLSRILGASEFIVAMDGGDADRVALRSAPDPTQSHLGPRLRLTWSVEWYQTQHLIQDLYLYPDGGPLLHTPPGQPFFDQTTEGAWHRGSPRLVNVLQAVGVPSQAELRASAAAANLRWQPTGSGVIARW